MKKVKLSKLQLKDSLTSSEKKRIVGGASTEIKIQCWCEGGMPTWYVGCDCPNSSCIVMSDEPEECWDLF